MNRVAMVLGLLLLATGLTFACGPTVVPASAVSYNTGCYQQQAAVYQQAATVAYAYPLAVLAVPTVTVPVQPAPAIVPRPHPNSNPRRFRRRSRTSRSPRPPRR